MFQRATEPTTKPSQLSARGQVILQKITLGLVNELRELKLSLHDLFEMDADKTSLIAHARMCGNQDILDEFYKIIVTAHLSDKPGVINTQFRCKYGYTLLHWAVYCNQDIRILDFLISLQFDINAKSESDKTPLYLACQYSYINAINLFVTHGADVLLTDSVGTTLLHIAANLGSEILTRLFVMHGVNALQPDAKGFTALDTAITKGNVALVSAMLEMDVSVTLPTKSTKERLMKLVANSVPATQMMKGFLLGFDTDEIMLLPEKLAAILGQDIISKMIKDHRLQQKHGVTKDQSVLPAVVASVPPIEKSDAGKRLREEEISPQVSPSISGGPVLTGADSITHSFNRPL